MTASKPRKSKAKNTVASPARKTANKRGFVTEPREREELARYYGGSPESDFNWQIVREAAANIRMLGPDEDNPAQKLLRIACSALGAFKPQDEIEGMIAAQAVALHFGAMEALRRSMLPDQPSEIAARLRKDGANLARAMTDMVDALDRKRGKAQQVVRVERVVVEDGGQAIVGVANALGGQRFEPKTKA